MKSSRNESISLRQSLHPHVPNNVVFANHRLELLAKLFVLRAPLCARKQCRFSIITSSSCRRLLALRKGNRRRRRLANSKGFLPRRNRTRTLLFPPRRCCSSQMFAVKKCGCQPGKQFRRRRQEPNRSRCNSNNVAAHP